METIKTAATHRVRYRSSVNQHSVFPLSASPATHTSRCNYRRKVLIRPASIAGNASARRAAEPDAFPDREMRSTIRAHRLLQPFLPCRPTWFRMKEITLWQPADHLSTSNIWTLLFSLSATNASSLPLKQIWSGYRSCPSFQPAVSRRPWTVPSRWITTMPLPCSSAR